ncbi:hypothetical protein GLOIN_2v515277 [Rhizophagus clarus]|nr:hypothetical protein GLOIN_2v515277 [Rhizophagus clarus]
MFPVEQSSSTAQKKRSNESTENRLARKPKRVDSEVMEKGTGDFFDLYNSIINMEGQEEIAKRDVIKSYFNFGKALDDCFNYYKKDNPKRTAQALVNKKVWEQLPNVSDDALRKKKERALKIFELFNEIGEDKIQKIKSFSASSISKLD